MSETLVTNAAVVVEQCAVTSIEQVLLNKAYANAKLTWDEQCDDWSLAIPFDEIMAVMKIYQSNVSTYALIKETVGVVFGVVDTMQGSVVFVADRIYQKMTTVTRVLLG
jgi:hypothetical protein